MESIIFTLKHYLTLDNIVIFSTGAALMWAIEEVWHYFYLKRNTSFQKTQMLKDQIKKLENKVCDLYDQLLDKSQVISAYKDLYDEANKNLADREKANLELSEILQRDIDTMNKLTWENNTLKDLSENQSKEIERHKAKTSEALDDVVLNFAIDILNNKGMTETAKQVEQVLESQQAA